MRFALVTLGSTGDLYPFLAIGRALREQGHEVFLLSQAPYRVDADRAGLQFVPVVDATAHARTLSHPKLWHPVDGLGVFWRHLCLPAARPTWEALRHLAAPLTPAQPLRVLASPLAVGARLARDTTPLRLWSAYLAPAALRNLDDPMFLGPWALPNWIPQGLRKAAWRALDRWKLEPMARQALCDLASATGAQPPHGSVFGDWIHSPDGGLALYDASFAPLPQRLAGALDNLRCVGSMAQVGFPNFEWEVPRPLASRDWPPRPWLLFGGSAGTLDSQRLAQALAQQTGRACIVLGSARQPKEPASENGVISLPAQALPPLLWETHAFVHHGGIGSCAQGLAAGIPQLLIPQAYDQFENAAAIQRMGAGVAMPPAVTRRSPEEQVAWISAQAAHLTSCARAPQAREAYSLPGAPNTAVRAAVGILTAP